MAKQTKKNSDKPRLTDTKTHSGDLDEKIEEGLEELAATFNAGPKAAPPPEDPTEGEQWAPG